MILALGDDPENELSRHCDALMDGLMKLIASYVPPTIERKDCQSRAAYMAAVARGDTAKRKSWSTRFLKLFPGLKLEPGWRLSCLEEGDSENGFKTLFLTDGNGGFCEDMREHMRLVGNPDIAALATSDCLPRVELNADGSTVVRYVTFSPLSGFAKTVMTRGG